MQEKIKDDTIRRQDAIDEITEYGSGDTIYMSVVELKRRIEHLPSAQPEIIRCKDCRHAVDYYHDGDCYCSNPKWGLMYFGGSWEFYCADAERRTDETD